MKTGLIIFLIVVLTAVIIGAIILLVGQSQNNLGQNISAPAGSAGGAETGGAAGGAAGGQPLAQPANIDSIANSFGSLADQESTLVTGQDGGASVIDAETKAINNVSNSYDETQL